MASRSKDKPLAERQQGKKRQSGEEQILYPIVVDMRPLHPVLSVSWKPGLPCFRVLHALGFIRDYSVCIFKHLHCFMFGIAEQK